MDDYFEIGNFHKEVTTNSKDAQLWVNRGLINLWGFNHQEAIRCFNNAISFDKDCVFAYWAIAYAYGPHYNLSDVSPANFLQGKKFMVLSLEKQRLGTQWEADLVEALRQRYPEGNSLEGEVRNKALKNFSIEMKKIHEKYPTDLDISVIYAEAVMNLRAWQLWKKDGKPYEEALIAKEVLEEAYKQCYHPQIVHLLIHLLELSPLMKEALPYADELYNNTKNISHLIHMPSHVYVQLGDYLKCVESNKAAVEADKLVKKYMDKELTFFEFYRAHNVHVLIWSAMFMGDYNSAINYSRYINEIINEDVIKVLGNELEFFLTTETHVLIRFGKWDEILNQAIETREADYPICMAIQRYARAIAQAVKGNIEESEIELKLFKELRIKCENKRYGNNKCKDVFNIAENMILGELNYRKKNYESAFQYLRTTVKLSDDLIYDQPWDWMQPARHALGALLLEQGLFTEAEEAYQEDLKLYPDNIWSLIGLDEIYEKQDRKSDREFIQNKLKQAKLNANENIFASCYCKKQPTK